MKVAAESAGGESQQLEKAKAELLVRQRAEQEKLRRQMQAKSAPRAQYEASETAPRLPLRSFHSQVATPWVVKSTPATCFPNSRFDTSQTIAACNYWPYTSGEMFQKLVPKPTIGL